MERYRIILLGLLLGGYCLFSFSSCSSSKAARSSASSDQGVRSEYAEIMDVEADELERIELYRTVDEWMGTPYAYGGQSTEGVDCSGFVGHVYRKIYGVSLPRQVEGIYERCDRTFRRQKKLEEGDLVFFDIKRGKKASHAGIYLQNGHFVHASTSSGVVISKLSNPYYDKHFHRGGRIR